MKLSEHFTLEEMTRSDWAIRHGYLNVPDAEQLAELQLLCMEILEPVRDLLQAPIRITSGFRSDMVNHGIGGARYSQHTRGQAADFEVVDKNLCDCMEKIYESRIPYDQLILEGGRTGWIHISRSDHPRREALIADFMTGRAVYSEYDST